LQVLEALLHLADVSTQIPYQTEIYWDYTIWFHSKSKRWINRDQIKSIFLILVFLQDLSITVMDHKVQVDDGGVFQEPLTGL